MAATRVYILARELGVKSAAIVEKCQAEGLDVKNHMSVISAGLAATIREWFSEGENITTVETAKKVDLKKVKIKKAPEPKKPAKKAKEKKPKKTVTEKEPAATAAVEPAEPTTEVRVVVVEEPPEKEPEPILPAGPIMVKPEPARLSGPQVVRVEAPEPLTHPRPKARYDEPVTDPLMYSELEQEDLTLAPSSEKGRLPKRYKERTHGRRRAELEVEAPKKLRVSRWRQRDIEERQARLEAAGGEGLRLRPTRKIAAKARSGVVAPVRPKKAVMSEPIAVKDLSAALAVKATDIVSVLMRQGVMATANQTISSDAAELVALEFGAELVVEHKSRLEDQVRAEFEQREKNNLNRRSVVATMLGHVDHGKTSLLDKIRSTQVTAGEAGGITQHIGAYQVTRNNSKVTFLDTPGHEAFTAMRARGANMTDVAVLVVAADDGVMPQTVEAIAHSRAAKIPIIVALNKMDLPGCDINRIYSQLAEQGLAPTDWGGDTEVVKTSAVTGEGIDDLLEHLDYVAELLELRADDSIPATGWVVEAKMSAKRGTVATLLIKEGRLSKGDAVLAGSAYGRVKTLKDSFGKSIRTAVSSTPVEMTGLSGVPQAGDRFYCLGDLNRAKAAAEESQIYSRESSLVQRAQVTLENLFSQIEAGNVKELNLIIRADVQGSVDVLTKYLSELSTDEVKIRILHAAPGGITEGDVVLAEASNAIIIGFNVIADEYVAKAAEAGSVDIRLYSIIYRITEDLKKSMVGLLEPQEKEKAVGRAVARRTFKVSRVGTVAGCYVNSGLVTKNAKVRLIRDNVVIRDNLTIESLKHFKDDVREVKAGLECGIKIAKFDDIKVDDVFDFYEMVKVERTL
jgi:translation initiation factor IF-2